MAGPRAYKGIWDCVVQTYHSEGINGFFRGMPSTLIRSFPVNAVTFSVVTWMLRWMEPSTKSNMMYQDASQLVHDSLQNVAAALAQENQTVDWPYHCDTPWLAGWKRLLGGQFALNFMGAGAMPVVRNYATLHGGSDWLLAAHHRQPAEKLPGPCACSDNGEGQRVKKDGQAAPCGSENCAGCYGDTCQKLSHSQLLLCCHPAAV